MDRKDRLMLGCTLAIMATVIGCAWWLHYTMADYLGWVLRDLEQR